MKAPTFVAELSGNHRGDLAAAERLVKLAKHCGADAIKLQTFDPDRMVADKEIVLTEGPWKGRKLYDLYKETWTPHTWHKRLFNLARSLGMFAFSSPFSPEDVDLLEEIGCPIYKIASFEITDIDLIRYAAQTKKPMVISTGMAVLGEIEDAVDTALAHGARTVTILVCTSGYPAPAEEANLRRIPDLVDYFAGSWEDRIQVGLSDHSIGCAVPVAAIALGAVMIEKHLTEHPSGPDGGYSAMPETFERMVTLGRQAHAALGEVHYGPTESEKPQLWLRRGLWVVADIPEGGEFTRANLRACRPNERMKCYDLGQYLGKKAKQALKAGTIFSAEFAT